MSVNADTYWQELKGFKSGYYSTFIRVNFETNEDWNGRASEHHWVRFDEVIVRSYHEGYVRDLDHNFYFSLNKKHSRALQRDRPRAGQGAGVGAPAVGSGLEAWDGSGPLAGDGGQRCHHGGPPGSGLCGARLSCLGLVAPRAYELYLAPPRIAR
jgi:hypothetical protein